MEHHGGCIDREDAAHEAQGDARRHARAMPVAHRSVRMATMRGEDAVDRLGQARRAQVQKREELDTRHRRRRSVRRVHVVLIDIDIVVVVAVAMLGATRRHADDDRRRPERRDLRRKRWMLSSLLLLLG